MRSFATYAEALIVTSQVRYTSLHRICLECLSIDNSIFFCARSLKLHPFSGSMERVSGGKTGGKT